MVETKMKWVERKQFAASAKGLTLSNWGFAEERRMTFLIPFFINIKMTVSRLYIACFVLLTTFSLPANGICQNELNVIDQKHGVVIEYPDSVFSFLRRKRVVNDCKKFLVDDELLDSIQTEPCRIKTVTEYRDGKMNGKIQYFILDTVLLAEGYMLNGAPHGLAIEYRVEADYKTGQIVSRHTFIMNFNQGKRSGPVIDVYQEFVYPTHDSPSLSIPVIANIASWQNNVLHGPEIVYDHRGNIHTYRLYDEGKIVDGKYLHSNLEIVQYKNGEAVEIWNYSYNPPGRLVPSGFKGLNLGYTFFNFNRFKFPIRKLAHGKMDYHQFINSQLAK